MLCQLVCVDRRYQRMNCFNIREIQSILKRKFFTDLINNHDHRTLLNKTVMGLRFKTNSIYSIHSNMFIFYNYGIEFSSKIRSTNYFFSNDQKTTHTSYFFNNSFFYSLISYLTSFNPFFYVNNFFFLLTNNSFFLSGLNLTFKNIFNSLIVYCVYFIEYGIDLFFHLIISFINFFNTFSAFIKSTSELATITLYIPGFCFYMSTEMFFGFFYNNIYFYKFFTFKKSFNSLLLTNHKISDTSFNDFFLEFFLFTRFFEIFSFTDFFFYKNNSINSFLNLLNLDLLHFYNLQTFVLSYFINYSNLMQDLTVDNFGKGASNLYIDENNILTNYKPIEPLFSQLNYNSYLVYFYIILYFIINTPYMILLFLLNMFNYRFISDTFFNVYESLTT